MVSGDLRQIRVGWQVLFCAALLLMYVSVRILNTSLIQQPREFPDTDVFTDIASQPLSSLSFWAGGRPFVVPLVYKALNSDFRVIAIVQLVLSVMSWTLLGIHAARAIQLPLLRPLAFGVILLFSLNQNIIEWDTAMLSESFSLSLFALFLACWLWLLARWQWRRVLSLVIVAFLWTFSRETNAWMVLLVGLILIPIACCRKSNRKYLVISALFVLLFFGNELSSNRGQRWVFPFLNVLGQRVLPRQEYLADFARCGMPITPALTRMAGKAGSGDDWAFYNDPALEGFRVWLYAEGKPCYMRWLISNPQMALEDPLAHIGLLLADREDVYSAREFVPVYPPILETIVYPSELPFLLWWASAIAVGLAVGALDWRHDSFLSVPLLMTLLVYPHAFLVWHGDAMEVGRHALQVGIQWHLGMLLLLLFGVDRFLMRPDDGVACING